MNLGIIIVVISVWCIRATLKEGNKALKEGNRALKDSQTKK